MFKRISLIIITLILVGGGLCYAAGKPEQGSYQYSVDDFTGNWQTAVIEGRKVIFTKQKDTIEQLNLDVPEDGYYQLYISLYHRWRKFSPFIFIKAKDSRGKHFKNYVFSEPRWYLQPGEGRWEYRCVSGEPFWRLSKGKLNIKFWIDSRQSCWEENEQTPVEGLIAIDGFILKKIDKDTMSQTHSE